MCVGVVMCVCVGVVMCGCVCRHWGKSVTAVSDEEKKEEKLGFDRNGFNEFASRRIPLDRTVPDTRHKQ